MSSVLILYLLPICQSVCVIDNEPVCILHSLALLTENSVYTVIPFFMGSFLVSYVTILLLLTKYSPLDETFFWCLLE